VTVTSDDTGFQVRSLLPLAAVSASVGLATALALPFMALFLSTEVGAGPVALGTFLLVTPLAALVASTLIGRLSDARAVRRPLLIIGATTGAAGYALFSVLRDYWILLAVSSTLVAVASSLLPQMFAYAKQVLERGGSTKAPLAISSLRTLISVAWVAGPPLAALLVAKTGYTGLFITTALVYTAVAALTLRLPEIIATPTTTTIDEPIKPANRNIVFAVLAFILIQGAVSLGVVALPLFVTDELHGTTGDAGLILGLCAALEIPLMIGFGVLAMRIDHRRLVGIGAIAALAYHSVMLMTTNVWQVAAAQALNAVVISAAMGVGISYFQTLAPDRPGYATTMFTNSATVAGMLSGPLLGAAQLLSYRAAYGMSLTMSALGLGMLLLVRATGARPTRPTPSRQA
jgi:SET family sugar efflux transporter-like MFS transporter